MRPKDKPVAERLLVAIEQFQEEVCRLPGISSKDHLDTFVMQILESIHRVQYVRTLATRSISSICADPTSPHFNPTKAAILHLRAGRFDEACWLIFLWVHCGRKGTEWKLARLLYGGGENNSYWDWESVSSNPAKFRNWLAENEKRIKAEGGFFGNHRKYQSLDAWKVCGTGAAVETYVHWIGEARCHKTCFAKFSDSSAPEPSRTFDLMFRSMAAVVSFGRTARFDYLTMLGRMNLAQIEPPKPYLEGATGPLKGAKLLVGGNVDIKLSTGYLSDILIRFGQSLDINMQVIEDSLCNWQKSPARFEAYRGGVGAKRSPGITPL